MFYNPNAQEVHFIVVTMSCVMDFFYSHFK